MIRSITGVLTALMLVFGLGAGAGAAYAAPVKTLDLPTWDDVQKAKKNTKETAAKIEEIEFLLEQVRAEVEIAQDQSAAAMSTALEAEEAFMEAALVAEELKKHAEESRLEAEDASQKAGSLVSQIYRSGGVDRNLELFLETDASTADALLDKLAMMEKATERTTAVSEEAWLAMNNAKSLGEQAEEAQAERERLFEIAEKEYEAAALSLEKADQNLRAAEEQEVELTAQLEALKDTEAKTVDGYKERLRKEEEARRERERKAAEEARKREAELRRQQEEAARQQQLQQQQQQNNNPSTPAPNPPPVANPGPSTGGGWARPLPAGSYRVTTEWFGYPGHAAMDLAAPPWTPIYAASSGTVTVAGWVENLCGYGLLIQHAEGVRTQYCHMVQSPSVYSGQYVSAGQIIGYIGSTGMSTGPHVHFEIAINGIRVNPRPFMNDRGIWL